MENLFINVKGSKKIGVIRFPLEIGILFYSNGSEVIFFPRGAGQTVLNRTNRALDWSMKLYSDKWQIIRSSSCLYFRTEDSEFSDAFWGMTENNRFVTVAIDFRLYEKAEEEIFWCAHGIENKDRDFTENILDFLYTYVDNIWDHIVLFTKIIPY